MELIPIKSREAGLNREPTTIIGNRRSQSMMDNLDLSPSDISRMKDSYEDNDASLTQFHPQSQIIREQRTTTANDELNPNME